MAKQNLNPMKLLSVVLLVLCIVLIAIPTSASQIDLVDREDFVVDIQLTVYNVRHQYYTDGDLDGTVYDGYASHDGQSNMDGIVSGTAKLTSYNGNTYRYAYYTADSANRILTLVYTRESAHPEPVITEPSVTEPPVTEPPATEPPPTEPPETKPEPTEPPATQPENPAITQPPVEEVTEEPVEEETPLEAEPVAQEPAPAAETPILDDPVPLAPAPEAPVTPQAVKEVPTPAESPQQAEAPKNAEAAPPWLSAVKLGAIGIIVLGAVLLLFSFLKIRRK